MSRMLIKEIWCGVLKQNNVNPWTCRRCFARNSQICLPRHKVMPTFSKKFHHSHCKNVKCFYHRRNIANLEDWTRSLVSIIQGRTEAFSILHARSSNSSSNESKSSSSSSGNDSNSSSDSSSSSSSDGDKEQDQVPPLPPLPNPLFFVFPMLLGMSLTWMYLSDDPNLRLQNLTRITLEEFVSQYLTHHRVSYIECDDNPRSGYVIALIDQPWNGKGNVQCTHLITNVPEGNFGEALREFENNMRIPVKDRVPIRYRSGESTAQLALFLLSQIVLLLLLFPLVYRRSGMSNKFKLPFEMKIEMQTAQKKPAPKQETPVPKPKPLPEHEPVEEERGMNDIMMQRFMMSRGVQRADKMITGLTFKDIAGLHEAKIEIMEFVRYIKDPEKFEAIGAKIPRGALLLGPPGCGKTLLAKALAAECGVPFFYASGSDFQSMLGGGGSYLIRDAFKQARKVAPSIIFIDEIDSIGSSRDTGKASQDSDSDNTLNQLLAEMDGMQTKKGVVVFGSTNRPETLDPALRRAGRFDRKITIGHPSLEERKELFQMYLSKLTLEKEPAEYVDWMAQMTDGRTGADIANICNEAAIYAASQSHQEVSAQSLLYALDRTTIGKTKKTSTLTPHERSAIAIHQAGRVLVSWLLEHAATLMKVSITPRTNNMTGFTQFVSKSGNLTNQELFDQLCVALAGAAAEKLIFKQSFYTAEFEEMMKRATESAYDQITKYGMSDTFGLLSFPTKDDMGGMLQQPYSKGLQAQMDVEARQLVSQAFRHAETILQENKEKLEALAKKLVENETLFMKDVEAVLGPSPYRKDLPLPAWTQMNGQAPPTNGQTENGVQIEGQTLVEQEMETGDKQTGGGGNV